MEILLISVSMFPCFLIASVMVHSVTLLDSPLDTQKINQITSTMCY